MLPQWRGWHPFRRGLATNLNRLGVDDSVIQRILRHSNVAVTQACYIKTASEDVKAAMQKLETALKRDTQAAQFGHESGRVMLRPDAMQLSLLDRFGRNLAERDGFSQAISRNLLKNLHIIDITSKYAAITHVS